MKTRHDFQAGDLIRHGERTGYVRWRGLIAGNDVAIIAWDDGEEQVGAHSKLWMCDKAEAFRAAP